MISDEARKRLKVIIKKTGLVETPVWNKRTGNLVGGHQRLGVMDDLHRGNDYLVTVAVVDLDDTAEKKLNIALNNQQIAGEYDSKALGKIVDSIGVTVDNLKDIGFDMAELMTVAECEAAKLVIQEQNEQSKYDSQKLREIEHSHIAGRKEEGEGNDDAAFYVTMVFSSRHSLGKFLIGMGFDVHKQHIDGHQVAARCGINVSEKGGGENALQE